MKHRILLIDDLIALLRKSNATIGRQTQEAREGKSDFPLPISAPGKRRMWNAESIEQWLSNRNTTALPITPAAITSPAKSEKAKARDFAERQKRATDALARHSNNRKGGSK